MRLFVYGTLKRGLSNFGWMGGQLFLGEGRTAELCRLVDLGGYPGMIRDAEAGYAVEGELWEVDAAALARLDLLEDVADGEYARQPVRLQGEWADTAVAYFYQRSVVGQPEVGPRWTEAGDQ
ncbi:MAG: gamma-glutamylcyclotransferase [Verrucomicrobiales bacterium]|nr:gamma-glutamylcyclotransferase [Verrucomicrobiales bacterium]